MSCWIRSEIFDHAVLHSSSKWNIGNVSSFMEELKLLCPNRMLTQSKWIESVTTKMSLPEAQCYWSVFMACRQSIRGHVGEWMDLSTLGIFLFCQAYANARARAESSQHNEALVHTLATTMAVTSNGLTTSSSGSRVVTSHRSQLLASSSKLVRDNPSILQFVIEHLPLLLTLVSDIDLDISKESLDKLDILFVTKANKSLSDSIVSLSKSQSMKASALCTWLATNLEWNTTLYPPIDFGSAPENMIIRSDDGEATLLVTNINKSSILIDHHPESTVIRNAYISNCSDTVIYVSVPLQHVSIIGSVDCEIVMMAVTGATTVSFCEKVVVRAVTAHMRLENVIDTHLYIHTSRVPLLTGDTRGITLAPFNVVWSGHEALLTNRSTLHPDSSHATLWSQPVCACLSESPYILLQPTKFRLVYFPEFSPEVANCMAVCLPQVYSDALVEKMNQISELKREIQSISDETNTSKVNAILSGHFREWLSVNNKTKVIVDFIKQKTQ